MDPPIPIDVNDGKVDDSAKIKTRIISFEKNKDMRVEVEAITDPATNKMYWVNFIYAFDVVAQKPYKFQTLREWEKWNVTSDFYGYN